MCVALVCVCGSCVMRVYVCRVCASLVCFCKCMLLVCTVCVGGCVGMWCLSACRCVVRVDMYGVCLCRCVSDVLARI